MLQMPEGSCIKIIHTLYYRRLSGAPKRSPDLFFVRISCVFLLAVMRKLRGMVSGSLSDFGIGLKRFVAFDFFDQSAHFIGCGAAGIAFDDPQTFHNRRCKGYAVAQRLAGDLNAHRAQFIHDGII